MKKNTLMRGFVVAVIMSFATTLLGVTQPGHASAPMPTPPTKLDRSGSNQDEFVVPDDEDWFYEVNGVGVQWGKTVSTMGAASVTVDTYASYNGAPGPSFVLSYDLSVTAQEAPNGFELIVGACNESAGETEVFARVTNPADASGRYLEKVAVEPMSIAGGTSPMFIEIPRVLDGSSQQVSVKSARRFGLPAGTWTVDFWADYTEVNGPGALLKRVVIYLPTCGYVGPPSGDPGDPSQNPPPAKKFSARVHSVVASCKTTAVTGRLVLSHRAGVLTRRGTKGAYQRRGERAAGTSNLTLGSVKKAKRRSTTAYFTVIVTPADHTAKRVVLRVKAVVPSKRVAARRC